MDDDKFALVEKIVKDVDQVMSKNAELYAFDIVPVESNFRNKSPVLHLENCLGLESWCVKHVYMYCYSELMDNGSSKPKLKITKISSVNTKRLTRLMNVTLLLNPELSFLWNRRREMVQKCLIEKPLELQFTKVVLSRKPKCNEAFAHRRWLVEAMLQDENLQNNYIENLINEELHICMLASDKCPNNYHSWNHRIWLLNILKTVKNRFDIEFLYIKEYGFSERWSAKHISDFSCYHYRQFCIKNILLINEANWKVFDNINNTILRKRLVAIVGSYFPKDVTTYASEDNLLTYSEDNLVNLLFSQAYTNCNCIRNNVYFCRKLDVLFSELVLNNESLRFYKYHETLWYHRRFIMHEIITVIYDYFGLVRQNGTLVKNLCKKCNVDDLRQKQAKIIRYDSNRVYSSVIFKVILNHEQNFVEERQNENDNYAIRHKKYFKFVEGLNNVM